MSKLGTYEYPEIALEESLDLGRRISREFSGEISRQGLARILRMSERGGAFSARIGALRMWGIAEGRSRLRLTRDGLRAVTPVSTREGEAARVSLASNIGLFTELSVRLGDSAYTPEQFAVLVEDVTSANPSEIRHRLALLDRLFNQARVYLPKKNSDGAADINFAYENTIESSWAQRSEIPSVDQTSDEIVRKLSDLGGIPNTYSFCSSSESNVNDRRIELHLPDGKLSLPETLDNLDAVITVLQTRRQVLIAAESKQKGISGYDG